MNKIFFVLCILTIWFAVGCSEDKLATYDGRNSIYFEVPKPGRAYSSGELTDTTRFSFVDRIIEDTLYPVKVMVLGDIVHYDRHFIAELLPDKTTGVKGVNYVLEGSEFIVPADSVCGYVRVKLIRTTDLLDTTYQIGLALRANEPFELAIEKQVINKENNKYVDLLHHYLLFNDHLEKPLRWDFGNMFGEWTPKKHLLINKLLDMDSQAWSTAMPGTLTSVWVYIRTYLQDKIDQGKEFAIREADGSFMKVTGVIIPDGWE